MNSLKAMLIVSALAVMIQPALAMNEPRDGVSNTVQTPSPVTRIPVQSGSVAAGVIPRPLSTECRKAKPALSAEERARRQELKAQRAAQGLGSQQNATQRNAKTSGRRLPLC